MSTESMYSNKIILAPMVRIGTLPMRLLALDNGADLVYSEEIIDWKLLRSVRLVNVVLETVDYIDQTDGTIVFRTCSKEKSKVILQIGTSDPERALQVARLVEHDVAGIDVNMGCPKEFSIKGGMGAALLSEPDRAQAILRSIKGGVECPVTCKIRVLEDFDQTLKLCEGFVSCGISAIAVHGRTQVERPQHPNRCDYLRKLSESLPIPVIANGGSKEIETFHDIMKFKENTNCSSVMIARAAEWNVTIFRKEGKLPLDDVIRAYLKYAVDYDNAPSNTKYCIQNMLRELQETEKGKKFLEAQTLKQIWENNLHYNLDIDGSELEERISTLDLDQSQTNINDNTALWNMDEYYTTVREEQECQGLIGRRDVCPFNYKPPCKELGIIEMEASFLRSLYRRDPDLPKTKLCTWAKANGYKIPHYETKQVDKLFQSTVSVGGKKYRSSFWEKNKRWAEQGAAIVCLCYVGVLNKDTLKEKGIMR